MLRWPPKKPVTKQPPRWTEERVLTCDAKPQWPSERKKKKPREMRQRPRRWNCNNEEKNRKTTKEKWNN